VSLDKWDNLDQIRAMLTRIRNSEDRGSPICTEDLEASGWESRRQMLKTVDELMSSGYLEGRTLRRKNSDLVEYSEMRLGTRAIEEQRLWRHIAHDPTDRRTSSPVWWR
jgi:hypothetical protein